MSFDWRARVKPREPERAVHASVEFGSGHIPVWLGSEQKNLCSYKNNLAGLLRRGPAFAPTDRVWCKDCLKVHDGLNLNIVGRKF